jgi:hypothetical protein
MHSGHGPFSTCSSTHQRQQLLQKDGAKSSQGEGRLANDLRFEWGPRSTVVTQFYRLEHRRRSRTIVIAGRRFDLPLSFRENRCLAQQETMTQAMTTICIQHPSKSTAAGSCKERAAKSELKAHPIRFRTRSAVRSICTQAAHVKSLSELHSTSLIYRFPSLSPSD